MRNDSPVIVVDDNVALAENLRELLEDEGARVRVAASGTEALALIEAERPALVVSDVRMPGMSGVDVLRAVRSQWPGVPVVLATAYSRDGVVEEARQEGALAVLPKPLDLGAVCDLVTRALGPRADVLVVEDDPPTRAGLLEALMELDGIVPHTARGVGEATRVLESVDVAAAIVDLRLHDGSGSELVVALRERFGAALPVVVVSGFLEELGSLRPDAALEKPYETERLLHLVRELL